MYQFYPSGNPHVVVNGVQYLVSDKIREKMVEHFNCSDVIGIPLEDQDGTSISSHLERKVFGNEYMIASNKKGAFISQFTLAIL